MHDGNHDSVVRILVGIPWELCCQWQLNQALKQWGLVGRQITPQARWVIIILLTQCKTAIMMCSQNLQRPFLWAAGFDEIISEHVSERFWVRDLFSWCTYVCTYVAVTLMNVAGFWVVGFWHAGSGYLLGFHLPQGWREIFNFEDRWTIILCLQGLAVSTRHLYTAAPFTADKKKVGRAWNEAMVWVSELPGLGMLEQLHVESNNES